jgi:hypothetical protein
MRALRVLGLAFSMLVVLAGCGDDDAVTTTAAVSTTGAVTTPATGATTTAVVTTTVDEVAARVAAAQALAGTYTGEWTNTTFGSSGGVGVVFEVDAAAATATLALDLAGSVFGGGDPEPLIVEFDLSIGGPYAGSNGLFGDFTVEVDADGHVVMTAPSIPALTGMTMVTEGEFTGSGFAATYVITHPAGSVFAEGTMTAQRDG